MTRRQRSTWQPQRVVGIGASAGGLEPLRQLLAGVPADTGLAFVILQHLPPAQTGKLARALASATAMPVVDAKPGHRVAPNTVVVVPPRTSAALVRGALVLRVARSGARPTQPIDGLLTSLVAALGASAVGVVLSGTASDGSAGLRAIRAAGGIAIVQDPSTAEFADMPRNALAAGGADLVLPPWAIGEQLAAIASAPPRATPERIDHDAIGRVLALLREASGIDFTSYKRSTIERRLARAMRHHGITSLDEFARFLAERPGEVAALYEDLLIHVTEFFRDAPALEAACARLADDAADATRGAPVRVWVAGCSTGEEVYSLAMLLTERLGNEHPLQLFGTDLSERAIEVARRGRYPAAIADHVDAARLARFFIRDAPGYRIRSEIRERCVFVRHDLVTDPPFSRVDLVSCRNVLIYLGPELQRRVIPIFHYALNQPGLLLLGRTESVAGFEAYFTALDPAARLFARKPGARAVLTFPSALQLGRIPARRPDDHSRSKREIQREVDQLLLARYAPPSVVVDEQLDVIQFRGRTSPYLEAPSGPPQLNLLRMARGELASELRSAIQRAQRSGTAIRKAGIRLRERGRARAVDLEVLPVPAIPGRDRHFVVVFADAVPRRAARLEPPSRGDKQARPREELVRLRQELEAANEFVRSVTAQHAAATEELGLVNEELQSTNEELQSTNEELQTSKEELQSTNEELETVNDELQRGNAQLRETNDDLLNVLASIDIAIVIVDTEARVRRFTPKARAVFRLIPGDVGRPIADLRPTVATPPLDAAIREVIETFAVHEAEVCAPDGAAYRMQIRPYRTADHRIDGAVLAFVDVSELRASVEAAREARDDAAAIVQSVPNPLVVIDDELRVRSANRAFVLAFAARAEPTGRSLLELGAWSPPELRAELHAVFEASRPVADLVVEHASASGERRTYLLAATPIRREPRALALVGLTDVTAQRKLDEARDAAARQREAFVAALSDELRMPLHAMLLWIDVLRGLAPGDPRHEIALDTIAEAAHAESRLVDDLLELAGSTTGELAIEPHELDPAPVIRGAVDGLRSIAEARGVELRAELGDGVAIQADPRRLHQIATELVSNAIQFTPPGGSVDVELATAPDAIELRVADSGPGIPDEFLPHLFEPFTQHDRSSTRVHRGLGIGLALVRDLVVRQAGSIDVARGQAGGATFIVRFPAKPRT